MAIIIQPDDERSPKTFCVKKDDFNMIIKMSYSISQNTYLLEQDSVFVWVSLEYAVKVKLCYYLAYNLAWIIFFCVWNIYEGKWEWKGINGKKLKNDYGRPAFIVAFQKSTKFPFCV